jgi:hypothetical protein
MSSMTRSSVREVFASYPSAVRDKLMVLRKLIFDTAATMNEVGEIEETLKWGEPAYLTSNSGSGSTIRIGWKQSKPDTYAMYFNCQTSLITTFKTLFPNELNYEGNRAIVFEVCQPIAMDALTVCLATALRYHQRNRRKSETTTNALSSQINAACDSNSNSADFKPATPQPES